VGFQVHGKSYVGRICRGGSGGQRCSGLARGNFAKHVESAFGFGIFDFCGIEGKHELIAPAFIARDVSFGAPTLGNGALHEGGRVDETQDAVGHDETVQQHPFVGYGGIYGYITDTFPR